MYRLFYIVFSLFSLFSCNMGFRHYDPNYWGDSNYTYEAKDLSYDVIYVPRASDGEDNETINININGVNSKDIYFIITTTGETSVINPVVNSPNIIPTHNISSSSSYGTKDRITKFNNSPFLNLDKNSSKNSRSLLSKDIVRTNSIGTVGEERIFYDDVGRIIDATCRFSNTIDNKALNVWVENKYWDETSDIYSTPKYPINQSMIDALSNKFLKTDKDDIYHWITNIFGEEWGVSSRAEAIDSNNKGFINILLYDIDSDENQDGLSNGGVLGFFYGRDALKSSAMQYSNECLIFYLDAPFFAYYSEDDVEWRITNRYPAQIISTLAHEFQHMINFYQKLIKVNTNSSTESWLNELCSMVAEDFVADKLGVDGPRGVKSSNPASIPKNFEGRLPLFNGFNSENVTMWHEGGDVLKSYSTSYAFGSYIARNFGGAKLFNEIVKGNSYVNYQAVVSAVNKMSGKDFSFLALLREWGASVILSDHIISRVGLKYNNGDRWYESTISGTTYRLGSINLYNYMYTDFDEGPYFLECSENINFGVDTNNNSNFYVKGGSKINGPFFKQVHLRSNQYLTIVMK